MITQGTTWYNQKGNIPAPKPVQSSGVPRRELPTVARARVRALGYAEQSDNELQNEITVTQKALGNISGSGKQGSQTFMYPKNRVEAVSSSILSTPEYQNGYLFEARAQTNFTVGQLSLGRKTFRTASDRIQGASTWMKKDSISSNPIISSLKNFPISVTGDSVVANFVMPMSKTDSLTDSHNFNANKMSKIERSGGSAMNFISNILSDAAAGLTETVTGGYMADSGEQVYNVARNSYSGANIRTKTFTWDVSPRNLADLKAFLACCAGFRYLSYGYVKNTSKALTTIAEKGADYLNKSTSAVADVINQSGSERSAIQELTEAALKGLANAQVVTNPTVFYIKNYRVSGVQIENDQNIFGPCQIESMTVDQAVDGQFIGLQSAPNIGANLRLTITFREIIALNRSTI